MIKKDQQINEIKQKVDQILEDLDFFKSSKNFVQTIDNIETFTKTSTIRKFLEELKTNVTDFTEEDVGRINAILFSFLEKNKKKHIQKMSTKG